MKEEANKMINMPLCHKCSSKMIQPDLFDKRCQTLAGCKELTKKEWEEGYRVGEDGILFQHNCPIMKGSSNE